MRRFVWIYALCEADGTPRYVGKTVSPSARFRQHLSDRRHTRKARWIRALAAAGCRPHMVLLEAVPLSRWVCAELRWTLRLSRRFDLVNMTVAPPSRARRARRRISAFLGVNTRRSHAPLSVVEGDWESSHAALVTQRALASAMHEAQASVPLAAQWMEVSERTVNAWLSGRHPLNINAVLRSAELRDEFLRYLDACDTTEAA